MQFGTVATLWIVSLFLAKQSAEASSQCNAVCPTTVKPVCNSLNTTIANLLPKPAINDPTLGLSVYELITTRGYPAETHKVTTSDGYIIEIQRVKDGKVASSSTTPKPVVLLQHGLTSSSYDWVLFDNSWAFQLADAGYDVWLTNVRGNAYGQKHVNMTTNDPDFWKFCVDDLALTDLKGHIDYILNTTGQSQLNYLGHSMGTVMFFALMSTHTEYNAKVKVAALLAPSGSYACSNALLLQNSTVEGLLKLLLQNQGLVLANPATALFAKYGCGSGILTVACYQLFETLLGPHPCLNRTQLAAIMTYFPSGASFNTLLQFAQAKKRDSFSMYDYGVEGNKAKYNQAISPAYIVSKVSAPVALFHSCTDVYADLSDVQYLVDELPNVVLNYLCPQKDVGHTDFTNSLDLLSDMVEKVTTMFKEYNP